jgi:hypothetical protein
MGYFWKLYLLSNVALRRYITIKGSVPAVFPKKFPAHHESFYHNPSYAFRGLEISMSAIFDFIIVGGGYSILNFFHILMIYQVALRAAVLRSNLHILLANLLSCSSRVEESQLVIQFYLRMIDIPRLSHDRISTMGTAQPPRLN